MMPMQHMMQFPVDHPVEEVGRQLFAVLIKHLGLGTVSAEMVQLEIDSPGQRLKLDFSTSNLCLNIFIVQYLLSNKYELHWDR